MFRSLTNTHQVPGMNSGITSNIKSIYGKMSWTTIIMYVMIVVFLILIGYFTYKQFMTNTSYKPNRENMNNSSNKEAELILFYVDWCPHCKTAKPEWEKLKTEYESKQINGYNIVFTEYNCTNETAEIEQLMNQYKIEGYPTIKLLKDNQIIEYDAKPSKATLEQFLNTVL